MKTFTDTQLLVFLQSAKAKDLLQQLQDEKTAFESTTPVYFNFSKTNKTKHVYNALGCELRTFNTDKLELVPHNRFKFTLIDYKKRQYKYKIALAKRLGLKVFQNGNLARNTDNIINMLIDKLK